MLLCFCANTACFVGRCVCVCVCFCICGCEFIRFLRRKKKGGRDGRLSLLNWGGVEGGWYVGLEMVRAEEIVSWFEADVMALMEWARSIVL